MKKTLCFSGSTRKDSTCMAILQTIASRQKGNADFEIYPGLAELPHFDPDAEETGVPVPVLALRDRIQNADAVIIATPEYVFSPPAILKNALEWCVASTVFSAKPTAMIVASGAGEKTFESLALILRTLQCSLEPATLLHLKGVRARMLDGNLTDGAILGRLDALASGLLVQARSLPA